MSDKDKDKAAQRWTERKERWVPHHLLCSPRALEVEPLGEREASRFILTHHYSGSYPAAQERFGLYQRGELCGVAVFGPSAGPTALERQLGGLQGAELLRFVLLDEVAFNAETIFLSRCFSLLRQRRPSWRAILAYSDPVPRRDEHGGLVLPGHWGQIYQASSAAYRGRATPRTLYLDARGRVVSERAISKLRRGEQGAEYARRLILESGAPEQREGESVEAWLVRCRQVWRKVRHPGNHVYCWGLRKGVRFEELSARPKAPDPPR